MNLSERSDLSNTVFILSNPGRTLGPDRLTFTEKRKGAR